MRLALALAVALLAVAAPAPARADTGWCGTDQTATDRPDTVTGPQLHLVYAYPSDGGNDFAHAAPAIVTDVTEVDAWWRGQDPTRTPRFDLAAFPGGCTGFGNLDLGVVQLDLTAAQLTPNDGRYEQIYQALPAFDDWKKVVVYYDGPLADPTLCGTGGGDPYTGSGSLAVIYMRSSCTDPQTERAAVLAHEMTHEMGAPTGSEPHPYPGDTGHVGDAGNDLMYPYLSATSLDELVLDVGRDDYYSDGGSWFDLANSGWLRHLDVPQQQLAVTIAGTGSVASDLPGVACTATCSTLWDAGTQVTLNPTPGDGQRFVGWQGACTGDFCKVTLSEPTAVTAVFGPSTVRLTVRLAGRGTVTGPRITCPGRCSAAVSAGDPLTLRAKPAKGWRFAGWTGGCRGTRLACSLSPQAAVAVQARFLRR